MADDLDSEDDAAFKSSANGDLPTWSGTPATGVFDEDESATMGANRWIADAEGEHQSGEPQPSGGRLFQQPQPPENRMPIGAFVPESGTDSPAAAVASGQDRRRPALVMLLGLATALALSGFVGWYLGRASTSSVAADQEDTLSNVTNSSEDSSERADAEGALDGAGSSISVPGPEPIDRASTTVATSSVPFLVPETADNPSGATQYAVMADGKAIMRGWYPTAEQAQGAVAAAAEIMGGTENVLDETLVDPRAEVRPDSFAVYLQDFILFDSDSSEITPDFYEFLGFPLFFMQNNPEATVTVVARTDARGSASYNLELATRRAEAVRDYWLANGGNEVQIILDPRGEEDAIVDADDSQAALDRRVELQVSGFLTN